MTSRLSHPRLFISDRVVGRNGDGDEDGEDCLAMHGNRRMNYKKKRVMRMLFVR